MSEGPETQEHDWLRGVVARRLAETHQDWWCKVIQGPFSLRGVLTAYAGTSRRAGILAVTLSAAEQAGLKAGHFDPSGLPLATVARVTLLLTALGAMDPSQHLAVVEEVYRTGDLIEMLTALHALPFLPHSERFVTVAGEGVRSNAAAIVEAIACDNAYPAQHFTRDMWNQMVMKAVFMDLSLKRVVGLAQRNNDDLARIASDFADERRAAGRPVPQDLQLITE